ncbi:rho GTPase-activating protein 27 isoform X1 [Limanda limanda]|uniref:rho GTPase-activating protein 27 isoform X1 n=1 Tax=Limanda limanda TaxID=27771 RepID=UPI0029C85741|nr:rho GTPase-activating protein 27 isoform X1 [Limanda limanda]XP_060946898.1 rho GTPase-activating protein 27 isoform X1 [Limanda limanda]XP_060946899.1 rho GTPase-activating protein 27 isoform X1 [Limanda limanda]XP_060946900.1 rho GTPase-activating protein 27 isoform X1 [Limanda limanda]XP_060946901.1 rho GTPase-activating protein 27 isoform X1 [Limanda limanda]
MAATSTVLGRGLGLILVEFEYEYQGRDGVLVSIKPNERYELLAKTNDHWWQVRRDSSSKPFYIPAKYVKELPVDFPSPLDFDDPTSAEPVLVPVAAPVPVPIPVPKTLEEPNGNRIKQGDEVTIRLKPDASAGYRKTENRMSTFGVPLDFHDLSQLVQTSSPLAGPAETATSRNTYITQGGLSKKQPQLPGCPDDHKDSVKPRLPPLSPADPLSVSQPQTQAIPVEMPVVPVVPIVPPNDDIQSTCSLSEICPDHQDSLMEPEEEAEEEMSVEESSKEEEDLLKEQDSNHIYESIQDLNLDLEVLVRERVSPGPGPELATAPPPTQDHSSLGHNSPIYANISVKKTSHDCDDFLIPPPPTEPAPFPTGHTPSSVSSPDIKSPASPVSLQDEWQVHTDHDSGRMFYFHPVTRQTTWTDPHSPTAPPAALASPSPLLSPASSQDSSCWEQLLDEASGRFYYFNPFTRATSWTAPEPLSPSSSLWSPSNRKHDDSPPPLPEEDYPVEGANDTVFTTSPQPPVGLIPRVQMELKDGSSSQLRMQEPQTRTGNGVSEEGASLQVRSWRHSVAEDTFALGHRRNVSDLTEVTNRRLSPDGSQFSDRHRLKRNLSNRSTDSHQLHGHQLEKAGIINKTKVVDNGKRIRKNWSQSWTVLHGGILTFHRDPKSAPTGNASKASQIVPEYTVDLRGSSVSWAAKDKSSKKNVVELKTRQGCEFLMQYDTESIISDWLKVIQEAVRQLEHDVVTEDEDDAASDREDKERRKTSSLSSSGVDSEQTRVRTKLRRFLQRRPTLQSVKEKGYIRDNVFGCHLDTLCHREHTTIPTFLQKCIKVVERRGLDVDGIYRVSGNLAVIQKLRHKADHEEQLDLDDGLWQEIHVITGALKLFLRELPEPLFPFSCFDKFIAAIQVPDHSLRVSYMKDLVRSLPLPNHDTMELLFKHLHKVTEHRDSNRMSVQSVAIVFGPTLLRPQTESPNMTIHMVFQSQIVELMLNEFQFVFSQT